MLNKLLSLSRLDLLGANASADPTDGGLRVAESIDYSGCFGAQIRLRAPNPILIYVAAGANNVTIEGFLLDGDNPGLASGVAVNGADIDAEEAIASYEGSAGSLFPTTSFATSLTQASTSITTTMAAWRPPETPFQIT